ncbi:MAG: hypothetical protein RLZZ584_1921 [Pseudomonadota bacterium]|jgi:CRP-like cAMP-binding protein
MVGEYLPQCRPAQCKDNMNAIPVYLRVDAHPQAQACAACEVRRTALFGALDARTLEQIHERIVEVDLEPEGMLYRSHEQGAVVYTIREGIVRFERVTQAGERRIVRLAGRGDLIGQEALVRQVYADEAIACTNVKLCRIPSALVDRLGDHQVALLRELMQRWQRELEEAHFWIADLAMGPARRRVLRLLLKLSEYADADATIWLPRREEMAVMLDMAVETASRIISQLGREGVLQATRARSTKVDLAVLTHTARLQDEA